MKEFQQQLVEKNKKEIEKTEEAIKLTKSEAGKLEAELKIEEKLFEENLSGEKRDKNPKVKDLIEQVEANIAALKSMLIMKQNKLKELETEFKILKLRQPILERNTWFF